MIVIGLSFVLAFIGIALLFMFSFKDGERIKKLEARVQKLEQKTRGLSRRVH